MKKVILPGIIAGFVLLAFSYLALFLLVSFLPSLAEQYYNPVFSQEGDKTILYFLHPFVLSFALAWFWERFKGQFEGHWTLRGLELGLVYGIVATLPSMWITFSSLALSFTLVASWFVYGIFQAAVVGLIYAKMNP
ncbi:MAG: hypothetical protein HUU01_12360 [Saprospiraceae bacterium]|nr:hypothetical protein [Saprospiraceae bacterium]